MRLYYFLFLLLFISCTMKDTVKDQVLETKKNIVHDPHTYAKPEDAVIRHLNLDLSVDFEKKVLTGKAQILFDNLTATDKIILDTRELKISKVTLDSAETETKFILGDPDIHLGQSLTIDIAANSRLVNIYYTTSADAPALQWLSPEQTAGKKSPFLFTQSQAILARSWVPIQDGPGIRFTYDAQVHVPKGLMAVMSAKNPQQKNA